VFVRFLFAKPISSHENRQRLLVVVDRYGRPAASLANPQEGIFEAIGEENILVAVGE
jgi:hypothetical protein